MHYILIAMKALQVSKVSASVYLSDSATLHLSASDSLSVFLLPNLSIYLSFCLSVSLPLLTGLFAVSDSRLWLSYLFRWLSERPKKQQAWFPITPYLSAYENISGLEMW